ncbi:MAG: DUF4365 domain-containing protein [Caulobacterales bacterium]|jgi:hypothetical protein|nr:DUF4365 domain-containing protein [Caulobacterales bacterium]
MSRAKQQVDQHLIDREGQALLRRKLPRHWVLREYPPDYGLDFVLELFSEGKPDDQGRMRYETLGEHVFIQLKTIADPQIAPLQLFARSNVEKAMEVLRRDDLVGEVDTYRFPLETPELVTIERMGIGVPVLLVIADLANDRCSFVCVNDYIDKILIPRHEDYRVKATRTIHVPVRNEIGSDAGQIALRWYAKRPKLMAAFQRFTFQFSELGYAFETDGFDAMARYFLRRILPYDFWDDVEMWQPIAWWADALRKYDAEDGVVLFKGPNGEATPAESPEEAEYFRRLNILELWRCLSLLPKTYEDICREWFLPTALSEMTSAPEPEAAAPAAPAS